jgi:DNA-binding transcriptional ArsR family regulator
MQRHVAALILARIATLACDRCRAAMLCALADGRPLSLEELARCAGIPPPAAREHLGKLIRAGLLEQCSRGPRTFYKLASPRVERTLDDLWFAAERYSRRWREGPAKQPRPR